MKLCATHWAALRGAIEARGLSPFVARNGAIATAQLQQEINRGASKATFDPLMSAHWAIMGNAINLLQKVGAPVLYLMAQDGTPEDLIREGGVDPPEGRPGFEGRTWPRCPLCYLNVGHEMTCTDPRCGLDKRLGYDWMIDRAADDALAQARNYELVRASSKG